PERIPAVLLDHLRRELDAGADERLGLLHAHAADTAHDVVFGRQVLSDRRPLTARPAYRELTNRWRAAVNREARAQFLAVLTGPREDDAVGFSARSEAGRRLVLAHVALHAVGEPGAGRA